MSLQKHANINVLFYRVTFCVLSMFIFAAPAQATPLIPQLQPAIPHMGTVSQAPTPPTKVSTPMALTLEERLSFYGAGLGVALASVPLSLKAGAYLGTISNELYSTVLIPFGVFVILPAVAVTLAQHIFSHKRNVKTRFWLWPMLAGVGVQMAGFASGAMLGVNPHNLNELVTFSFVQALILPAVTTLMFGPQTQPLIPTTPVNLRSTHAPSHPRFVQTKSTLIHVPLWTTHF